MRRTFSLAALALLGGCVVYDPPPERRPADPPVTKEEALSLVRAGLSEPVVIELAEQRGVEPLDADTLAALKKAGASDPLLQKMIQSERRAPVVAAVPGAYDPYYYPYYPYYPWYYYPYRPVYPYPAYGIGVGFGYYGYYGHRHHYHGHGHSHSAPVRIYR
jgi:hypothetical protein